MDFIGLILLFAGMSACLWRGTPALSFSALEKVSALEGSCLIIPCSFNPALTSRRMDVRLTKPSLFLLRKSAVFSSIRSDLIHPDFRDRTFLAGNLSTGDCSVNISRIRKEDQKIYELQLKETVQKTWTTGKKINVSVTSQPEQPELTDPGPVKEGQLVVLNCSVRLSCPSERPRLLWKWERGEQEGSSVFGDTELERNRGQLPVLQSTLTFTVTQQVNPRIRCEVIYPKNKKASAIREVLVYFPPKDVSIQVQTVSVREGGNALLVCTCKADPPVSEYMWSYIQSGNTMTLPKRIHNVRIYNVTRDTRVQCTVANRLGQAKSPLTGLNVQYAPVILPNSSCEWDGRLLSCTCIVDSNPRPAVTWSVNGTHQPDSYNVSFSYTKHILMATLRGISDSPLPVECFAISSLGNDSCILFEGQNEDLLWTLIPIGSTLLFLLLLCLLIFCYCCRTNRQRYRPPAIHPENLGIYQERMPLYVNCSEVTHIYTNGSYQLVYQNCTPLFVRCKQTHKRQRRGAKRQRAQRERERQRPTPATTDSDTAIYVEVI